MGYTKRKIRGINFSFLLAGLVLACWALVCAWYGWPRHLRHGSAAAFGLFALASVFFISFPLIWARFPEKHPVNHELLRYGPLDQMSARLDAEMNGQVERSGPFRLAATLLVYDSGHEFQLIPYDQIASAELEGLADDDPPALVVRTRKGRRYHWYRTWMQGRFNPEQVLEKLRAAAHFDGAPAPKQQAG